MKYIFLLVIWLSGMGLALADTRGDLAAAGQQLESLLAECYGRVDFEASDAKRQSDQCDLEVPSASASSSGKGDGFDAHVLAAGIPVGDKGGVKWSLSISCYENTTSLLAFIADVPEGTPIGPKVARRLGKDAPVTEDWEVLDRTVFIADNDARKLAEQFRQRPEDELVVTTILNGIPSETRYSLKKLGGLIDLVGRACAWPE